jgi:hypothetical protein
MERTNFKIWLLDNTSKTLKDQRQYFYKLADQSDKIIVWLAGFSVTAIVLVIGKFDKTIKIHEDFNQVILIFSSLTIVLGLLYRIFLYVTQFLELKILSEFDLLVDILKNPPVLNTHREIKDKDTYDDIIKYIETDFNMKIDRKDISLLDPKQVIALRCSVAYYYNTLCFWDKKIMDRDRLEVKEIFYKYLGNPKRKVDKAFKNPEPNRLIRQIYWICVYLSRIFFIMTCLSFATGIIIMLIKVL